MDTILEKSKDFEYLVTTFDPAYKDIIDAIEIVKKFIIDNGLIVYGGTAIDFALRLHGDKIYPDDLLKIPDLDVYSPNSVEHSYKLADLLYERGYKESRAINAQHMETMRVDLMDNHFIADITFRPPELFDSLPTLNYNGMKIIHPLFQRLDLHSSLSFPYDNVPREVIFDRWGKDIKRFNKLDKHYPVKVDGDAVPTREVKIPSSVRKYVFSGFAAYAIIYQDFVKTMQRLSADVPKNVTPAKFTSGEQISFDTLDQKFEIAHFDTMKAAKELKLTNIRMYEPYINMIPERIDGSDDFAVTIYSTKNRLVASNSVKIDDQTYRIVNVQFLMKHFLAMYFVHKTSPKIANSYLIRYVSMLNMISGLETAIEKVSGGESAIETASKSPLFPTVVTYGSENINLAREVALNQLYAALDGAELYKIPKNYYPGRSIPKALPHPVFNPEDVEFFREQGREIKK